MIGTLGLAAAPAWAQSPSASFEALAHVLPAGQKVIVRDEGGHAVRGDVVTVSDTEIVILRARFFRSRARQSFTKDAVQRIDIVDPTWDGAAWGAVFGAVPCGILVVGAEPEDRPYYAAYLCPLFVAIPAALGQLADAMENATVYERQVQQPRVAVAPLFGRARVGVMARIQF